MMIYSKQDQTRRSQLYNREINPREIRLNCALMNLQVYYSLSYL